MTKAWPVRVFLLLGLLLPVPAVWPQSTVEVKVEAGQLTAHISPTFYGIMTEDINHAYDGGLYAELVRNRNFKENLKAPAYWKIVEENGASGSMSRKPARYHEASGRHASGIFAAAGRKLSDRDVAGNTL